MMVKICLHFKRQMWTAYSEIQNGLSEPNLQIGKGPCLFQETLASYGVKYAHLFFHAIITVFFSIQPSVFPGATIIIQAFKAGC